MEKEFSVAFQVVYQKFFKIKASHDALLSTEDIVIAEDFQRLLIPYNRPLRGMETNQLILGC